MLAGVRLDELLALHEHAARAAARVVDATLVGGKHLDQHPHHVRGRVELAAASCPRRWRNCERKYSYTRPSDVLRAIGSDAERDIADQVDDLAESLLVEAGTGEVFRQHALERGVIALDRGHRVIHQRADGGLRSVGLQVLPARLLRHPEDAGGAVFVAVFGVGALGLLRIEFGMLGFEGVGDVLQEDEAEHDVLVLGRVHVVTQRVGGGPQLGLEAEVGGGVVLGVLCSCHLIPLPSGQFPQRTQVQSSTERKFVVRLNARCRIGQSTESIGDEFHQQITQGIEYFYSAP